MRKTLLVTNDFPPRPGGIQTYLYRFVQELPPDQLGVYTSTWRPERCAEFDRDQKFPIWRNPTSVLLPTLSVAKEVADLVRSEGYETVWFGAAAPLALMSHYLRRHTNVETIVASTHGHEVGWAMLPFAHAALRRIGNGCDTITYVSHYTKSRIAPALGSHPQLVWLPSAVDSTRFVPQDDARDIIVDRHGLPTDATIIACISRLVPRKGQDTLIKALATMMEDTLQAHLLIVGGGPFAEHLQSLVRDHHLEDHVTFTKLVPEEELPRYYAAADIFAMPCRTRGRGLDVEGLGIVFLEASASGCPVIVGNSGGAPETVQDGITGLIVDGHNISNVREALRQLLNNPQQAAEMGKNGRMWAQDQWNWTIMGERLRSILNGTPQSEETN